jgi:hypothetical protein
LPEQPTIAATARVILLLNPTRNRCFAYRRDLQPDGEATAIEALPGLRLAMEAQMRPANESSLRARARKLGYCIHKSRLRSINEDNLGKFALVKEDSQKVVLGERFDASLEEIAEYLS